MNINKFYRYNTALIQNLNETITTNRFQADLDVLTTFTIGDGLLLAEWNDASKQGEVKYIGVVTGCIDSDSQMLPVVWFTKHFNVSPNPGGYQFWRKDFFKFAKVPAERYGLKQHFKYVDVMSHQ